MWLTTTGSLIRIDRSDIERALANPSHRMDPRVYDFDADLDNGLPLRRPRAAVGPNNTLWVITGGGLVTLNPRRFADGAPAPPARIESVDVDGRVLHAGERLDVPAGARTVQIGYTAMTLASPKTVSFQYRLEGFETGWTDAATRRQAFYTNLPPGSYRFAVRARHDGGDWSDRVAALDVAVAPLWYQRTSFPIVMVTAVAVAIWGLWQMRARRMRHEFVLVLTERVRMSRVIHDTLLQGLVAVALKLQGLMDSTGATDNAREEITRMRREVEAYIRDARRSIWNLRSTAPDAEDFAGRLRRLAERFAEPEGLDVRVAVNGPAHVLATGVEEQLLHIAQEAVVNVVRHAAAKHIQIGVSYDHDITTLTIADDGRGFVPAFAEAAAGRPNAMHPVDGPHCGLTTMRERAEEIGGLFRLSTHEGTGTTIEVVVGAASSIAAGKPEGASATFSWDPPAQSTRESS
jgi:signal transduction histidine kinase